MTPHNRGQVRPTFSRLVSQAASADQFDDPAFVGWVPQVLGVNTESPTFASLSRVGFRHRKIWEWAFILEAVREADLLRSGTSAVGFGVGREPIPTIFASRGIQVLATDPKR